MKKRIAITGILSTGFLVGALNLPMCHATRDAYYFDRSDKTIMIPKCESTDNREGCADNRVTALMKWVEHK